MTRPFRYFLRVTRLILLILLPAQTIRAGTMRDELLAMREAVRCGEMKLAAHSAASFEAVFGDEPEFRDPSLQHAFRYLAFEAAWHSGAHTEAIHHFTEAPEALRADPGRRYMYAISRISTGDLAMGMKELEALQHDHRVSEDARIAIAATRFALDPNSELPAFAQSPSERPGSEQVRESALHEVAQTLLRRPDPPDENELAVFRLIAETEHSWFPKRRQMILGSVARHAFEAGDYRQATRFAGSALAHPRIAGNSARRRMSYRAESSAMPDDLFLARAASREAGIEVSSKDLISLFAYSLAAEGRSVEAVSLLDVLIDSSIGGDAPDRADQELTRIRAEIAAGFIDSALAHARALHASTENSESRIAAQLLVARALAASLRHAQALAELDDLIASQPEHPARQSWTFLRGQWLFEMCAYAEAQTLFGELSSGARLEALHLTARFWEARTLHRMNHIDAAERILTELQQLLSADHPLRPSIDFEAIQTRAITDPFTASEMCRDFLMTYADHPLANPCRLNAADILEQMESISKAIALLEGVNADDARCFARAQLHAAKMERDQGEVALALERLQQAEPLIPPRSATGDRYEISVMQVGLNIELGQDDLARALFNEAMERFGNDIDLPGIDSLLELGDKLGALAPFATTLPDLFAQSTTTQLSLQDLRVACYLARKKLPARPEEAAADLMDLATCIEPSGADAASAFDIGKALAEFGFDSASEWLLRVVDDFPDSPCYSHASLSLGRLAHARGSTEECLEWSEKCLTRLPASDSDIQAEALWLKTDALSSLGHAGDAMATAEAILRLPRAPSRLKAQSLMRLAEIKWQMGELNEASLCLNRVTNLYRAETQTWAEACLLSATLFVEQGHVHEAERACLEVVNSGAPIHTDTLDKTRSELARIRALEGYRPPSTFTPRNGSSE